MFIGSEEHAVLADFSTEGRSFGQQVINISRLREKINQIRLDDISMQN